MVGRWVRDTFKHILVENCQAYLNSNNLHKTNGRTLLIEDVAEKIREASEGHGLPDPLEKAVATWFANQARTVVAQSGEPPAKPAMKKAVANPGKRWTTRGVAMDLFSDKFKEIHKRHMREYTGEGKANLRTTAAALSELMSSLPEDELEECKIMAEQWNRAPAPKEVQRKATKRLPALAKRFMETANKDMGVKVLMLVSYKNPEGQHSLSAFETAGCTFRADEPNWRDGPGNILQLWSKWLDEKEEAEDNEDDESEGQAEKKGGSKVILEHRLDDGYPLLPDLESDLSLDEAKRLLREYVREVRVKQNMKGRIPWAAIGASNVEHLEAECRCSGDNLSDPSRMGQKAVVAFLTHWKKRQEDDQEWPLRFLKPESTGKKDDQDDEGKKHRGKSGKGKGVSDAFISADLIEPMLRRPFLNGLSKQAEYQDLLELLDASDATSRKEEEGSSGFLWASWGYSKPFLPPDFHIRDGPSSFSAVLKWIKGNPLVVPDGGTPSFSQVESTILVVGLTFREFERVLFTDEETAEDFPGYVKHSDIALKDWELVVEACAALLLTVGENGIALGETGDDGGAPSGAEQKSDSPGQGGSAPHVNRGHEDRAKPHDTGKRGTRAKVPAAPRAAGPPSPTRKKRGRVPDHAGKAAKKARR